MLLPAAGAILARRQQGTHHQSQCTKCAAPEVQISPKISERSVVKVKKETLIRRSRISEGSERSWCFLPKRCWVRLPIVGKWTQNNLVTYDLCGILLTLTVFIYLFIHLFIYLFFIFLIHLWSVVALTIHIHRLHPLRIAVHHLYCHRSWYWGIPNAIKTIPNITPGLLRQILSTGIVKWITHLVIRRKLRS